RYEPRRDSLLDFHCSLFGFGPGGCFQIQPAEVGCGGGGFDGNVPAPPLVFHLAPAGFQLRGARGVDEPVRPEEEDRRRQIRVGLIGATLRREIRRREVPPQAARGDLGEVVLQRDLDPILN
ncbi:hypothetical protein LINPERHAP1_LOCUS17588, partial [Linum perenne]